MSLQRLIPGYAQALARESDARDAAFLDLPQIICGVEVRPLSLRDYLRLFHARSPFVCGGGADRADAALFLWSQRRQCVETDPQAFAAQFDSVDPGELCAAVTSFIEPFLMDAPKGGGSSAPTVGLGASIIHAYRRAYQGASEDEVLDMRLDRVWQYYRCIVRGSDPDAVFFNPSDAVKGQWLREQTDALADKTRTKAKGRKSRKK